MIAAVSIGLYPSMADCVAEWVDPLLGPGEPPEPDLAQTYGDAYPVYAQASAALRPVWRAMSEIRKH
jgi:erythritol kinase